MFQVAKDHHCHFICMTVGFGILLQAPVKTHLLPSGLVKTEESSQYVNLMQLSKS